MWEISNLELFSLLAESSEVTNEKMQKAYGEFIKEVKTFCDSDDNATIYRNLSTTRIEFAALELINRYEQGKKCPEICLS